jgi:hypothetical protein
VTRSSRPRKWPAVIRTAMKHVEARRMHPCTNCGMAPLDRRIAEGKLAALAKGAAMVPHELGFRRRERTPRSESAPRAKAAPAKSKIRGSLWSISCYERTLNALDEG